MAEEFTAKFKVDISDLKKNISDATKEIKTADAVFRNSTAGMGKWSDNADGLSAKIKHLDDTLGAQKSILRAYEDELMRNKDAYEKNGKRADELKAKLQQLANDGVNKTDEEYKKYQKALQDTLKEQQNNEKACEDLNLKILDQDTAVKNTESSLEHYKDALDRLEHSTGDLEEATEDNTEATKKANDGYTVMKDVLADLVTSGIKAAIGALKDLAEAAVDSWKAFDDGRDTIIKMTGATGEDAAALMDTYNTVSHSIVADSSDIAGAIGEVNTRFGTTGEELEDMSTLFLKFSDITGSDVVNAVDNAQAAMASWNLETKDVPSVLDAVAKASQDTGKGVDEIFAAVDSGSVAFRAMNMSFEDSVTVFANLEKQTGDASSVMAGLNKLVINAAKDGKTAGEAINEFQERIANAKDSTEATSIAMEYFGNKAAPRIVQGIQDGTLAFDEWVGAAVDAKGAVEDTYAATLDATDGMALTVQGLKADVGAAIDGFLQENGPQLEAMLSQLADVILPAIMSVIQGIMSAVQWVMDNIDWIAPLVGILGGVAAAIGLVSAAQAVLNAVMLANPIGIVIAAIVALVAAFVVLWNKSEAFRNFWISLWEAITSWVKQAVADISRFFTDLWNGIKQVWSEVSGWFSSTFTSAKDAVVNAWSSVTGWFSGIWNSIKTTFSNVATWFGNLFGRAWSNIKERFSGWVSFWSGLWGKIKETFSALGTKIGDAISGAVRSGINGVLYSIENIINRGIGLINGAIGLINRIPGVSIGTLGYLSLPRLARGGILKKGQVGLLEGSGAEAVVPLENNKGWVSAIASEMTQQLNGNGINTSGRLGGAASNTSFVQNNYSPKALTRIEIYRQTKNLLALARGGV